MRMLLPFPDKYYDGCIGLCHLYLSIVSAYAAVCRILSFMWFAWYLFVAVIWRHCMSGCHVGPTSDNICIFGQQSGISISGMYKHLCSFQDGSLPLPKMCYMLVHGWYSYDFFFISCRLFFHLFIMYIYHRCILYAYSSVHSDRVNVYNFGCQQCSVVFQMAGFLCLGKLLFDSYLSSIPSLLFLLLLLMISVADILIISIDDVADLYNEFN